MTRIVSKVARVWKSAQLYIGFHRDQAGQLRDAPHVWPPKNGKATLHPDPCEQEAFLVLRSAKNDPGQDVQIKLRPDTVVLRRDCETAWAGVKVDEHSVSVKVGSLTILIDHDGSVAREDGDGMTWLEADGGVLKKTEFVEAAMSRDGTELTRRTPDNLTAITRKGLLSKDR